MKKGTAICEQPKPNWTHEILRCPRMGNACSRFRPLLIHQLATVWVSPSTWTNPSACSVIFEQGASKSVAFDATNLIVRNFSDDAPVSLSSPSTTQNWNFNWEEFPGPLHHFWQFQKRRFDDMSYLWQYTFLVWIGDLCDHWSKLAYLVPWIKKSSSWCNTYSGPSSRCHPLW